MSNSFQESVAEFRQFLTKNGYPAEVVWVGPEDVILAGGRRVYVRVSESARNEESTRLLFEKSTAEQTGILFGTLCVIEGATCSYAWIPKDDTEREAALMLKGLKMSAKTGDSRIEGTVIRNPLYWYYLRLKHRHKQVAIDQLFQ